MNYVDTAHGPSKEEYLNECNVICGSPRQKKEDTLFLILISQFSVHLIVQSDTQQSLRNIANLMKKTVNLINYFILWI